MFRLSRMLVRSGRKRPIIVELIGHPTDLVPGVAASTEAGTFRDQRIVCHAAILEEKSCAEILALDQAAGQASAGSCLVSAATADRSMSPLSCVPDALMAFAVLIKAAVGPLSLSVPSPTGLSLSIHALCRISAAGSVRDRPRARTDRCGCSGSSYSPGGATAPVR